ncbi:MAG: type VI secretion protein VasK [Paraburkholderia sp.]|uniref:ImcF-related family protein n=1 Tax=Paraburkholderia sp. TaxID=1926495 RepID=UPI0011F72A0B|nr:ImcF-related family protein [Paraburkholderia sp.]TAL93865.1 MAG: type VI secretion protein VasK [Paraburkholderia sp.]
MNRKFKLDLFGVLVAVVLPGVMVWYRSEWFGIPFEHRGLALAMLCAFFVVLLMAFSFDDSSRPAVAWRKVKHWVDRQAGPGRSANEWLDRMRSLKAELTLRHAWRWRYRDRWIALAGDEALVAKLAPGLPDTGYVITGNTVLLYAKETHDKLETEWLDQICRLRRRRPIDAIVGIVATQTTGNQPFDAERIAQRLVRHARALRWAAPAYLLNVADVDTITTRRDEVIGCTWSNARTSTAEINGSLRVLSTDLADAGVVRLTKTASDRSAGELSRHISRYEESLSDLIVRIGQSRVGRSAVHGLLFAPLFKERVATVDEATAEENGDAAGIAQGHAEDQTVPRATWQTIATHSRQIHGRRVGLALPAAAAWMTAALAGLWLAGTMLSGFTNRATIQTAADTIAELDASQSPTQNPIQAAQHLDTLQKQLDTVEAHQHDGAPWYIRFGLNHDAALYAALWPSYESAVARIVVGPIRTKLESQLRQLASLSDAEIASGGEEQVNAAYATLKTYLMLARPEHADVTFLTPQLTATAAPSRPLDSNLSEGAWQDLRNRLIEFYANHLKQNAATGGSSLAIIPDAVLVNATRQTVIGVRGIQNSTDALYQQIIEEAKPKYPPISLATLLGGTTSRGLFNTTDTLSGVFTRTAWDERISKAIDKAGDQRTIAGDWVLSDTQPTGVPAQSLKADLQQRYFDDYARAWAQFLNGVRWQPATTLPGTVDQLTLLADPQRSPLVALMNVVVYQAGAGATTQSLSDTLINKAQQLVDATEKDPSKVAQPHNAAPLATAFGPLLRLAGSDLANPVNTAGNATTAAQASTTGELSVQRYMERVTAMRLKLQQIMMSSDPDAMSRMAAQAVLQGRTSDIADSRDYASRVAASLGLQWAGFGDLFQQPLDQTWQVVLQPAASNLNDTWRAGILADWNRNFAGRYPFADSDNDASLPEMARFMRPDSGLISQFVTTQLAGVVERQGDRWVAAQGSGHSALTVDPAFLTALNTLMHVSISLFPAGDARVRYELRAVPTPGVTDMNFVLSGRELHYFNQKEEWVPFVWPGDALENVSRIEWQTEQGGLRSALDTQGRFGLIRLLERATVTPQDNARYLLAWTPDALKDTSLRGQSQGIPLRVQLRSEAGAGPLDMLALRRFSLPQRIFLTGSSQGAQKQAIGELPPLPAAMLESARLALVPLPPGRPGDVRRMVNADRVSIDPVARHATAATASKQTRPVTPEATESRVKPAASEAAAMESRAGAPLSDTKPGRAARLAAGLSSANRLLANAFVY